MLKIRETAVAGDVSAEHICQFIEHFRGNSETLIVIHTDLSHFHNYEIVQKMDRETSEIIEYLQDEKLNSTSACAYVPFRGLLLLASKNNLQVKTIDLRSSGNTARNGDKNSVVGYGAYVIE